MRVEHGWIRFDCFQILVQDSFLSSTWGGVKRSSWTIVKARWKKETHRGKKRWGFYLTHKAKRRRYVEELLNRHAISSKRQTMFQPSEQKPAGFNVPYLHGNSLPRNHLPMTPAGPSSNSGQGGLRPTLWHRFAFGCRPGFLEPDGWRAEIVGKSVTFWCSQSFPNWCKLVVDSYKLAAMLCFALGGFEEFCIEYCMVFWMVFHECQMITDFPPSCA